MQPLDADGKWRGRIVGGWQKGDGFTDRTFSERYHVSPMIAFVPDDRTSITLIAAYQHAPSGGGYSGVPALGVPKWQASIFLSYDFGADQDRAGALAGLTLGGGVRYVGGSYGSTNYKVVNSVTAFEMFKTRSFTLVDALIGYDIGRIAPSLEGLSLAVNAQNLLNKRHASACPFSNSCYFGASRTVVGSLRYKW